MHTRPVTLRRRIKNAGDSTCQPAACACLISSLAARAARARPLRNPHVRLPTTRAFLFLHASASRLRMHVPVTKKAVWPAEPPAFQTKVDPSCPPKDYCHRPWPPAGDIHGRYNYKHSSPDATRHALSPGAFPCLQIPFVKPNSAPRAPERGACAVALARPAPQKRHAQQENALLKARPVFPARRPAAPALSANFNGPIARPRPAARSRTPCADPPVPYTAH